MSHARTASRRLVVGRRYRGLPGRALGGYVGGVMAAAAGQAALAVTLRRPVPLGVDLELEAPPHGPMLLRAGVQTLAEAVPWTAELAVPEPVTVAAAADAARRYWGFGPHDFPAQSRCFCCGPERQPADGLRVFPGPLGARRWNRATAR